MKERLVGAAVLVAIAVWLIPWVLDGPEAPLETNRGTLQLPAAEEPMPMRTQTLRLGDAPEPSSDQPQIAAVPTPAPVELTPTADAPPPAGTANETAGADEETPAVAAVRPEPEREAAVTPPAATQPKPAAQTPPKPAVTPAPAAAATGDWIVQLGSFGEEANARRMAQRSATFGYKAEVSSYRSGGRTLYRVRVPPARSRAEADATASALRAHGIKDASVVAAR